MSPDRGTLLEDLNEAQREAVSHTGGPLLVVAGAGTGKTRVLTRRAGWLVAGGLPGPSLLAITFTNKAADVLKDRLAALTGTRGVWAGTFHSFGAWTLRRFGSRIGIDPSFTILDRDDQERLVRGLLSDLGMSGLGVKPEPIVAALSHAKNGGGGRPPIDLTSRAWSDLFDRVSKAYTERLKAGRLLDFDDLLLEPLRLLREDEDAAEDLRARFAHVLVDEYQDTNGVQRELLLALAKGSGRITVVGDPDQSIYRWRGAVVRNILRFAEDFPGARTVVLEQNYRSTKRILAAAESVIQRNSERHAKRLFTENDEGTPVAVLPFSSGEAEADGIARLLRSWRDSGGRLDEAAVFYRVNSFSRGLELALRRHGVSYAVVAGVEFFQRQEVKDLLAYARLVENPRDEAAFLRIANVPRRGVGDRSVDALRAGARQRGISVPEAARLDVPGVSAQAKRGLAELCRLLDDLGGRPRSPVGPLLAEVVERTGYREALVDPRDEVGSGRAENLDELVAFAREFDEERGREGGGADLRAFLERTSLVSDQDALVEDGGRASLMSVHAAKGLEFAFVVVAGAEDGWFPHARSADDPAGLEEERRLFYVAMTRAKERLALTHAGWRTGFRGTEPRLPSPYLRDLPEGASAGRAAPTYEVGPSDDLPLAREEEAAYGVGDRVRHPYFGVGILRARHGAGEGLRLTIDFDAFGVKQLLASYARLEKE